MQRHKGRSCSQFLTNPDCAQGDIKGRTAGRIGYHLLLCSDVDVIISLHVLSSSLRFFAAVATSFWGSHLCFWEEPSVGEELLDSGYRDWKDLGRK